MANTVRVIPGSSAMSLRGSRRRAHGSSVTQRCRSESRSAKPSPLDHRDGVVEIGVDVQRVEFGHQVHVGMVEEAVEVDVHHRRWCGPPGPVHPRQHEGGRGDRADHIHASAIPLARAVFPRRADRRGRRRHQREVVGRSWPRSRECPLRWPERQCHWCSRRCRRRSARQSIRSRSRRANATRRDGVARSTSRTRASLMTSGRSICTRWAAPERSPAVNPEASPPFPRSCGPG